MQKSYDVIVLGLGAMGAASVYQLAKRGARVLGIDRHHPPHTFGSSHGDTRITRIACGEGIEYTPFARRSHEIWRGLEKEGGESLLTQNGLAVIQSPGGAALHGNAHFLETTVEAAEAAKVSYRMPSPEQFRAQSPAFAVSESDRIYLDDTSGFVRPERCIGLQLRFAKERGAEFRMDETIVSFAQEDGLVRVVTDRERYEAEHLVVCAGAWLPELLREREDVAPRILRQVIHWFAIREGEAFEDYSPEKFPVFCWQVPEPQIVYGFPALDGPDGGIKLGTEQYLPVKCVADVDRTVSDAETRATYETYVQPYFPGISERCLRSAVCLYAYRPDARFIIDRHPHMDRVMVVSACSGHGFKHSAAIGETIAQALGGEPHLDLSAFRFGSVPAEA